MGLYTGISLQQGVEQFNILPETATWLSRCQVQPDYNYIQYINNLIITLKKAGVWQKLDGLYLLNQTNFNTASYNLVQPKFDLTIPYGAAGFSPNSGYQGDGTIFLNTNCNLATQAKNYKPGSSSMFMWSLLPGQSSVNYDMGCETGSPLSRAGLRARIGTNAGLYANSNTIIPMSVGSGDGFLAWSRTDPSTVIGYKSGNATTFTNTEINIPSSSTLTILMLNVPPTATPLAKSTNKLALCGFGGALTQADLDVLYGACLTYLTFCGTIDNYSPSEPAFPAYFSPTSINQVKAINGPNFRVYQQIPPPLYDGQSNLPSTGGYAYYPESDAASQVAASFQSSVTTETTIRCHHWLWQMRQDITQPSTYNTRPNLLAPDYLAGTTTPYTLKRNDPNSPNSPYLDCRMQYTGIDKANAATETLLRYTLGFPAHCGLSNPTPLQLGYLDVANNAGIPDSSVMFFQDAYNNVNSVFPNYVSGVLGGPYYTGTDQIILSSSRVIDAPTGTGVVLDSEAQDGRTPDQLLTQLQLYAQLCASVGREFLVYPNALNGGGAQNTGFSISNLYKIHQTPNLNLCILAWAGNIEKNLLASLNNQINLLKGPNNDQPITWNKLVMTVGIGIPTNPGGMFTPADCATIRTFLANGMLGVNVWRYFGKAGGPLSTPYNQVLAGVLGLPTS